MRKSLFGALVAFSSLFVVSPLLAQQAEEPAAEETVPAEGAPADDVPLTTLHDKASYAIGLNIGQQIKTNGDEINIEILARGIADAFKGAMPLMTEQECAATMEAYTLEMRAKYEARAKEMAAKNKELAAKNRKEGEAFLAANKSKSGVKTLPSGLQYQVIKAGTGPVPKATDTFKAHYHGTLIDGTVFDSSVEEKTPIVIGVGDVIDGWQEALKMMKVGSKWKLWVPTDLAYGDNPRPGPIPPGATLIFEMELLGIE